MMKRILRLWVVVAICTLTFASCEKQKHCHCTYYVYSPGYYGPVLTQETEYVISIPEAQSCAQRNIHFDYESITCTEVD